MNEGDGTATATDMAPVPVLQSEISRGSDLVAASKDDSDGMDGHKGDFSSSRKHASESDDIAASKDASNPPGGDKGRPHVADTAQDGVSILQATMDGLGGQGDKPDALQRSTWGSDAKGIEGRGAGDGEGGIDAPSTTTQDGLDALGKVEDDGDASSEHQEEHSVTAEGKDDPSEPSTTLEGDDCGEGSEEEEEERGSDGEEGEAADKKEEEVEEEGKGKAANEKEDEEVEDDEEGPRAVKVDEVDASASGRILYVDATELADMPPLSPPSANTSQRWNDEMAPAGSPRCKVCGFAQNVDMLHLYRCCYKCRREVTPASALPLPSFTLSGKRPLIILAAAYGHASNPFRAFDVTDKVKEVLSKYSPRCHLLHLPANHDLTTLFGDPSPGDIKALKLRYVFYTGRYGEVEVREDRPGFLDSRFILRAPTEAPLLTILEATYGPLGTGTYDAKSVMDVTHKICGLADRAGGSYVEILHTTPLSDLFGLPCAEDRKKHLTIRYEMEGGQGMVAQFDLENHLRAPIEVKAAVPRLEPLIVITSAQYGRTREQIAARGKEIQKSLQRIYAVQAKQATGTPVSLAEVQLASQLPALRTELENMMRDQIQILDVTNEVQRRVEAAGGDLLHFTTSEDLSKVFGGDPLPGQPKELRISYLCLGSDADQQTSSQEITRGGYPRNTIRRQQGVTHALVVDAGDGRCFLKKEIHVMSEKAFPVLDVITAKYGNPENTKRLRDVTDDMRRLVMSQGGWKLEVPTTLDLQTLFGKCYESGRKRLSVSYMLRGIVGTFRIDTNYDYVRSDIKIGYPKVVELDEEQFVQLTPEELERLGKMEQSELKSTLEQLRAYERQKIANDEPDVRRMAGNLYCKRVVPHPDVVKERAFWPHGANLGGRMVKTQVDYTRTQQQTRNLAEYISSGAGHHGLDLTEEQSSEADSRYILHKSEEKAVKKGSGGAGSRPGDAMTTRGQKL